MNFPTPSFNLGLLNSWWEEFTIEKFMVENFMIKKFTIEEFMVERFCLGGRKFWSWNVLQTQSKVLLPHVQLNDCFFHKYCLNTILYYMWIQILYSCKILLKYGNNYWIWIKNPLDLSVKMMKLSKLILFFKGGSSHELCLGKWNDLSKNWLKTLYLAESKFPTIWFPNLVRVRHLSQPITRQCGGQLDFSAALWFGKLSGMCQRGNQSFVT